MIELRPPRREDAASIASVFERFGLAYDADVESVADLEAWFDNPGLDMELDARVAVADGEIVGYGDASDAGRDGRFVFVDLRVRPDRTDAEPALFDFLERRGREVARGDGVIKTWAPEKATGLRALIEAHGSAFDHYSLRMVRDLTSELPAPAWPDGIELRPFRRGMDDNDVYEAHQEAFADQHDFSRDPFDEWQHWSFRDPFDPALWFVAADGDEIAGISLCRPERGDDAEMGWVQILAVRRPWRRRGLGLALLLHSLRALRVRGKERAGLGVDATNPTGAVQLYERAGMTTARRAVWYRKTL